MRGRSILLRAHRAPNGTSQVLPQTPGPWRLAIILSTVLLSIVGGPTPFGRSSTALADDAWAVDSDGVWDDPANWQNGAVPDGVGLSALFGPVISAPRFVTVQDLPAGPDGGDNRVTLGEIIFDSPVGYRLRSSWTQRVQFDAGPDAALIRVLSNQGDAQHSIQRSTISGDVEFFVDSNGGLELDNVIADGVVINKTGRGQLTLGGDLTNSVFDIRAGTVALSPRSSNTYRLNGGTLGLDGSLAGSALVEVVAGGGLRVASGSRAITADDLLRGVGSITKLGSGALSIDAPQANYTGVVSVREGFLDIHGASGNGLPAASGFVVGENLRSQAAALRLADRDFSGVPVAVFSGGELIGGSSAGSGFATLSRGNNLTLEEDAVLVQLNDGANQSIGNLGSAADLYFGLGAVEHAALNLTVGAGTPWKGLTGNSRNTAQVGSGTITANSDFAIKNQGQLLILGDRTNNTAVNMVGPARRTLTVDNVAFNSDNADMSGVGKLVVNGTTFLPGRDLFGTGPTQIPTIDLMRDGIGRFTSLPTVFDELGGFGSGAQAATINVLDRSSLFLRRSGGGNVDFGGNIVVSTPDALWFVADYGADGNTEPAEYRVNSLRFTTNGRVDFQGLHGKQPVIAGTTDFGAFDVLLTSGGQGVATLQGPLVGSGTLRVNSVQDSILRFDGDLTGFNGPETRIVVEAGVLRLGDNRMFDLGPAGPTIELQTGRTSGVLSIGTNVDIGPKLAPTSTGTLALRGAHTTLSGVNGSYTFIGADGMASFTGTTLAPGAEDTYRLGGGTDNSVLMLGSQATPNLLTGDNNVVVGPVNERSSNTVQLLGSNNYTGATTVQRGRLSLLAPNAIGNGEAAGPIDVRGGVLEIRDGGTLGSTGTLSVYRGAFLSITSSADQPLNRVPDDTPVRLYGGDLTFSGTGAGSTPTETIGNQGVTLVEGSSTIAIKGEDAGARLDIGNLVRSARAIVVLGGISLEPAVGTVLSEQIHFGNANTILANGIIPWAVGPFGALVGYGPQGAVQYSGPVVTQLDIATATDNVRLSAGEAVIDSDTTVNSLYLAGTTVNTQGHVLNVGTAPIGGVSMGAISGNGTVAIGTSGAPGFLTAGQSAFAAASATPGELILYHPGAVVNAAIIDNAGPDGVFGNNDDLPVAVTGSAILNSPNNRYSGGTSVSGSQITANYPVPGNVTIVDGSLVLQPAESNLLMVIGDVVAGGKPGDRTTIRAAIRTSAPIPEAYEVRVGSLTVSPETTLEIDHEGIETTLGANLVAIGPVDIRKARLDLRSADFLNYGLFVTAGYSDDPQTEIVGQDRERTFIGFRTAAPVEVTATIDNTALHAVGQDTVVNFRGRTGSSVQMFAAHDSARLAISPEARINAFRTHLRGDTTGTIEFTPDFKWHSTAPLPGQFDNIVIDEPVTWITNHSDNLPNFTLAHRATLVAGASPGSIAMSADGATWRVQSNPQQFNESFEVNASATITTDTPLTLTPDSTLTMSGALQKRGDADLVIGGRATIPDGSIIRVREGRLVWNNQSAEGAGTLDIQVYSGATLSGGNATATAGLVPGLVHVEAGGKLAPGDVGSTGILSVIGGTGSLELATDAIYQPKVTGAIAGTLYDQVRVRGEVELGDGIGEHAVLAPSLGYAPQLGDLFFLIDNDGADPISGLFETPAGATLTEGSFFDLMSSANGLAYRFEIGYRGDSAGGVFSSPGGNDLVLRAVAIPEPATIALLLAAVGVVVLCRVVQQHRDRNPQTSGCTT